MATRHECNHQLLDQRILADEVLGEFLPQHLDPSSQLKRAIPDLCIGVFHDSASSLIAGGCARTRAGSAGDGFGATPGRSL